jgi:hypothetical protein
MVNPAPQTEFLLERCAHRRRPCLAEADEEMGDRAVRRKIAAQHFSGFREIQGIWSRFAANTASIFSR